MSDEQQDKQHDDDGINAEGFGFKLRLPAWVKPYVGPALKWAVISASASLFVYIVGLTIRMIIHD